MQRKHTTTDRREIIYISYNMTDRNSTGGLYGHSVGCDRAHHPWPREHGVKRFRGRRGGQHTARVREAGLDIVNEELLPALRDGHEVT